MSSKQQFRDALKEDKKIIADLKKEIADKDNRIHSLNKSNLWLKDELLEVQLKITKLRYKKWYQFWK